jgi:hypothetical protein
MPIDSNKTERVRLDGVETALGQQLDSGSSVITFNGPLIQDGGVPVPTLTSTQWMSLSVLDDQYRLAEIVHLVEYTEGDSVGTVDRGMDGTSALQTHTSGNKVVHAPTATEFQAIDAHFSDPNAHADAIKNAADLAAADAVRLHEAKPDPHPQYAMKGSISVEAGDTLNVYGVLHIHEGATLLVDGTIDITSIGKLIINGKQLVISNSPPTAPQANVVWIQTFG